MSSFLTLFQIIEIKYYAYFLCCITILINLFIVYKSKTINLFLLFQSSLCFFILNRIFFDIFYSNRILQYGTFGRGELSVDTKYELILYLIIAQIFLFVGYISSNLFKLNNLEEDKKDYNLLIYGLIVFFISAPIYFYKSYLKYQVVMKSGYLSIHTGIETAIEYPIWTFGVGILLEAAFCFIIASRPSFKIFFLVFIIFFSLKYFDSMRGQRVLVAIPIVFFVWYVIKNHLMKFNLKSIILCFLSFIISIYIFTNVRNIKSLDQINLNNISLAKSTNFLYGQSVSILVLGYMIEFKNEFRNDDYPYILHKAYMLFNEWEGQSQKTIDTLNSLSDELAYFLNKNLYLKGRGIGSSFLGDFYDLGFLGYIFSCFITGMLIYLFEKYYSSFKIIRLLSFYFVGQTLWMARAETFYFLKNIIFLILIYFFAKLFIIFTKNTKLNFNNW